VRTIVVAGGDGSVNAAANALLGSDAVLGVLPLGTMNHFAKDIGIPSSLPRAVACIASGVARRVDVASVNGRVFVNNSSVGAYPTMLRAREARQRANQSGKRMATLLASLETLRRPHLVRARIEVDGEALECVTPFLFVGNNEYNGNLFTVEWRSRLDAGMLWVYAMPEPDTGAVMRLLGRALVTGPATADACLAKSGKLVRVTLKKKQVRVALDGEAGEFSDPLTYQTHPRALRVIVPKVA
jgi:diacylglycerol kinase family enzyme